jgi:hypothetical protein
MHLSSSRKIRKLIGELSLHKFVIRLSHEIKRNAHRKHAISGQAALKKLQTFCQHHKAAAYFVFGDPHLFAILSN